MGRKSMGDMETVPGMAIIGMPAQARYWVIAFVIRLKSFLTKDGMVETALPIRSKDILL